uniref:histone deacetylase n=1 Tax=Ditylenchus dipsaci TaxID=166011 RepID=A0A915CUT9_9BILA
MSNLMLQASFASFLSMPSLLKNPLFQPNTMLEPLIDSAAVAGSSNSLTSNPTTSSSKPSVKFNVSADSRTLPPSLPMGGYPSLLKQQLRDLVLRRKSLVREEPEDESVVEAMAQRAWHNLAHNQNNQLKTGLAYDAAMSKHQCLCGENGNHVEHGGRVQSIWSRLIETGLVNSCERVGVRKASLDLLKLVHSATYVTFFAISPTACLRLDPLELP